MSTAQMHAPILVFDIETITDIKAGSAIYGLDLCAADADMALAKIRRQESGHDFPRLHLHEIVCISGLWVDEHEMKLFSFSREQLSEVDILSKFLSIFDKRQPQLVSWNGSQFDLPVILQRALYYGLSAPSLLDQGEMNSQKRYNNYQNRYHQRHVDLMDSLALFQNRHFQKLDDMACFLGFPGKRANAGYHVPEQVKNAEWAALCQYCEGDVLNTWLIFLRWMLLKGQLNATQHAQWVQRSIQFLAALPQHQNFLTLWAQLSAANPVAIGEFPAHILGQKP